MEEFSMDKISEILSSPDLMKNIQSALSQLNIGNKDAGSAIVPAEAPQNEIGQLVETLSKSGVLSSLSTFLSNNKAERIALLSALRPFLSNEKKAILDGILQILKVADIILAANMLKGG